MSPRIQNKNKNKKTTTRVSFGIKTFNIVLICLIFLAGFLYLTQVNASAVKGYIIRDLEIKKEKLTRQNKKLELTSQALQSVSGVSTKIQELGMVNVDDIDYLQAPGGEVAVAK